MRRLILTACFLLGGWELLAQNFEIASLEESYKGAIGEIIQAPVKIRNTGNKPLTLVIRRVEQELGNSQKNFFCPDNNCLDYRTDSYTIRLEPGQNLEHFAIGLEAGLTESYSSAKYEVYNKANPSEIISFDVNFMVEGKRPGRIYSSPFITIHDVYPNPVTTSARIDYNIHKDNFKAKIIIHNILGSALSVYELLPGNNTIKIDAEVLNTGIYFYTLYVNNEGVMTRKLMVKK